MPKIVDHEERRRAIIRATWQVIARQGIANTTTREIAKEANYSSGVLAHYFKDKADIMASAMRAAHLEVLERVSGTKLTGLAALREYLLECLPLDKRRRLLATIEASFWGQAVGDKRLIEINGRELDALRGRIRDRLAEASQLGELKPDIDIEQAIREFHVLIDGLSVQATLYKGSASRDEQIRMLDRVIERIAADPR
ncbi:TetR family transcriptional regulator [Antricoccus suffuscus]|uniref:TetR family transcriptional regulator n=1 Tax=Antricoccus suffuscus TaxID=1629062 RepID=A0A2T0ZWT9_9ACTN|nr:TetR family transcriptional regulator C-terminal domain-containing protein [Antricoccus suffuscus]PRZ40548.1 TetR family transcriptional regulator [Antricoccus suffuscus]